ncbi:MAG: hypothetical protein AAGC71_15060 [Pseudomonadota bacterium]
MYREHQSLPTQRNEFTAVLVLAPVAMALALTALMVLFLGVPLDALEPMRALLLLWCGAASLWLATIAVRPTYSIASAWSQLPAWAWVAGLGLLTVAVLSALSLVVAARLIETAIAEPALATFALASAVIAFWTALGLAFPNGRGATRFSGPDY